MDFAQIAERRVQELHQHNNVIDNVGKTLPNNDNVNVAPRKTEAQTNAIAARLVKELNNPDAREFYCKVAWKLSEAEIQKNLEIALRPGTRDPQKYFSWLCKRSLAGRQ